MRKNPQADQLTRGPKPAIPLDLWPELQRRERAGHKLLEMAAWLKAEHGIEVSEGTMSRTLAKVRAAAPSPPPEVPALEPQSDEDQLREIRRLARQDMLEEGQAKDRHSAARLLLSVMAEQRERRKQPDPSAQPVEPSIEQPPPAAPFGFN